MKEEQTAQLREQYNQKYTGAIVARMGSHSQQPHEPRGEPFAHN